MRVFFLALTLTREAGKWVGAQRGVSGAVWEGSLCTMDIC